MEETKVVTEKQHYKDIANAIRSVTGETIDYYPFEMGDAVKHVYDTGVTNGKMAEREAFWNAHTDNGNRANYRYAFAGSGWNDEFFKPTTVLCPSYARYMFIYSEITSITDEQVDFTKTSDMRDAFNGCSLLETLVLKISGSKTFNANTFVDCSALTNLTIVGTIESNNFNVQWSTKLTHDSLMSIINALVDKTGASGTWTVTLGDENIAKLTDAEQLIAQEKGWVLE